MSTAWIFPGHGAQYPGMGRFLLEQTEHGRRWLDRAEALSGLPLRAFAGGGPVDALTDPAVLEPLLAAISGAYIDWLRALGHEATAVAGYSAGEVAASYAAGVFDADTCLRIACRRGEILAVAAREHPGGMVSLRGLAAAELEHITTRSAPGRVAVAAYNGSHHIVIAGDPDALRTAVARAVESGAKAATIRTAGPWHTSLMEPARKLLARELAAFPFAPARVPVWASATGVCTTDPEVLRAAISTTIATPLRWAALVQGMLAAGIDAFIEVGPGRTLWGLLGQLPPPQRFSRSFLERSGGMRPAMPAAALALAM